METLKRRTIARRRVGGPAPGADAGTEVRTVEIGLSSVQNSWPIAFVQFTSGMWILSDSCLCGQQLPNIEMWHAMKL